ncbi:MAG TPA: NAD(P)-binding domain-containing protein [Candidatus Limnocylindrales bacterium]|nr:NAD(P)-binding domain-containing protein [Candidatus Limnocylindrales bacterium]
MKIGILGTGRIGSALGKRWADAGHALCFGSRELARAAALAGEVGHGAQGGSYADAAAFGEAVLLAVPWSAAAEVLGTLQGALAGKLLLDATNNLSGDSSGGPSAVQVQAWASGAYVVKAFNTVFFQILDSSWRAGTGPRPAVFMVGDDANAKQIAAPLIADAGFEPLDSGTLAQAGDIDVLARFIIHLGYDQGLGPHIAYGLLRLP